MDGGGDDDTLICGGGVTRFSKCRHSVLDTEPSKKCAAKPLHIRRWFGQIIASALFALPPSLAVVSRFAGRIIDWIARIILDTRPFGLTRKIAPDDFFLLSQE